MCMHKYWENEVICTRKGTTKEGSKAFEEFYQDLGTMNGKCRINNFAKHRKKMKMKRRGEVIKL